MRKLIFSIVTDSLPPGTRKRSEGSALFQLYQAFASEEQAAAMRQSYADGIGWGDAKQALFELIDGTVAPMRERYEDLMSRPIEIEAVLHEGAIKARRIATPFIAELRHAVGLRDLREGGMAKPAAAPVARKQASFKQYRESDGRFFFKLMDADGRLLLQSIGHASARDVGQLIAQLRASAGQGLRHVEGVGLQLGDELLGEVAAGVAQDEVIAALAGLADATH